jgi:hypothetical protein
MAGRWGYGRIYRRGEDFLSLSERAFDEARDKMRSMPDNWVSGG